MPLSFLKTFVLSWTGKSVYLLFWLTPKSTYSFSLLESIQDKSVTHFYQLVLVVKNPPSSRKMMEPSAGRREKLKSNNELTPDDISCPTHLSNCDERKAYRGVSTQLHPKKVARVTALFKRVDMVTPDLNRPRKDRQLFSDYHSWSATQ